EIDERGGLEPVLDLCRPRTERLLQPHVELGAGRNLVRVAGTADGADGPLVDAPARRGRRIDARRVVTRARRRVAIVSARARTDALDLVPNFRELVARDPLVAARLHFQVRGIVAHVIELGLELPREVGVARAKLGDFSRDIL